MIGRRAGVDSREMQVFGARFVPPPSGPLLDTGMSDLVTWMNTDHRGKIDPVVAAAMAHYQFETLHPFRDGNGRLGRFLIVDYLLQCGVLSEPTLSVSPWFEARCPEYYDRLLRVSTHNDWEPFVSFFARGLGDSTKTTMAEMLSLVRVQELLKQVVRDSPLRADTAQALVDLAVATPSFTVRAAAERLGVSIVRANTLVKQLTGIGVLAEVPGANRKRRFYAPAVIDVLTRAPSRAAATVA